MFLFILFPLFAQSQIPDGSFVRITVDGGVSPYISVSYDLTVRGSTIVASLVKQSLCSRGQQDSVRLIDGEKAQAILSEIERFGTWTIEAPPTATKGKSRDTKPSKDRMRYEFWVGYGSKMVRFYLDENALFDNPNLLAIAMFIREVVRSTCPPIQMRDVYHPPNKMGGLSLTSNEPGYAFIEGFEPMRLPLDGIEIVEGEHKVTVKSDSGRVKEFKVRIAGGVVTQVHVVFEGER